MKLPSLLFGAALAFPALAAAQEPALPAGLGGPPPVTSAQTEAQSRQEEDYGDPLRVTGFVEGRTGTRYQDSPYHKDVSLLETRAQFQFDKSFETIHARLTADLLYDAVDDDHAPDLEHGEGWLDLREASIVARPADFMDVKVGRQILTWGTGDLIFVNDMFPKDWVSFFTGRDVEYLKAPSDALKVSMFSELANLDVIYTPQFDPDRYISGERISFYSGNSGRIAGENHEIVTHPRNEWIDDSETAFRLYRTFGSVETALYAYSGYWKSPAGQTASGIATFPALDVYGASMRGTVYKGIGNLELGYYDSREDDSGTDPLIRNSELRFLAGYEQELVPNLTGGVQYYLERMMDYDAYRANLAPGAVQKDKNRHMVTVRLTRLAMNQNLELSLFNFWSPSDRDGYLRPNVTYKMTDRWTVSGGANIFYGKRRDTFWGQFEDNSNVYGALRYSF